MSKRLEDMTQQRAAKVQKLRQRGINPYPNRYTRTHTAHDAKALFVQEKVDPGAVFSIAGRVMAHRRMGKATFIDLQDGSGKIQAYFGSEQIGAERYELVQELDLGDFLGVSGGLFKTRAGEITVSASDFTITAKALQPLPEQWHGLVDV